MKFLISGASGFLGKDILYNLSKNQKYLYTIGRTLTPYNHINSSLSNKYVELPNVSFTHIIHLAGKAHSYPKTPAEIQEFEQVNHQGTINLLKALNNQTEIKTFVFASTVAVYGIEMGENISETYPTNPVTPYGKSKLAAEKAIIDWCTQKNINYLILRLPLIAGENPPGNLGAMKKAIQKGFYARIKGNQAKKSMVLASDIANLIANFNGKSGIYHLTDGYHPSFNDVEHAFEKALNKRIKLNIPISVIKLGAKIGDFCQRIGLNLPLNTLTLNKITSSLTFNDEKARRELNWTSNAVIDYLSKN